jgi:hypothetical protein
VDIITSTEPAAHTEVDQPQRRPLSDFVPGGPAAQCLLKNRGWVDVMMID